VGIRRDNAVPRVRKIAQPPQKSARRSGRDVPEASVETATRPIPTHQLHRDDFASTVVTTSRPDAACLEHLPISFLGEDNSSGWLAANELS